MYTIEDYLFYYKDITLNEVHFNQMDTLLFAILVYLPIDSFKDRKNLNDFINYSLKYTKYLNKGAMSKIAFKLLEIIKESKRYKNLIISNFVNIENEYTQYGACKINIEGNTIISYKGTNSSLIGWIENLRLGYEYPTYTQNIAIKYLKENINFNDKKIYVTGHSKGGNLALASAFEASASILKRIIKIYNFDGPGFLKEEYHSEKYNRIKNKIINIIPTGSIVGVILNNEKYTVVKSNDYAVNEHYPNSWCIFGEKFIEADLSTISIKLHENTTLGLESLEREKVKDAIETIIDNTKFNDKNNFNLNDLINIIKNMKTIDRDVQKYILKIINTLINNKEINNVK